MESKARTNGTKGNASQYYHTTTTIINEEARKKGEKSERN